MRANVVNVCILPVILCASLAAAEPVVITSGEGSFRLDGDLTSFELNAPGTRLGENVRGSGWTPLSFLEGQAVTFHATLSASPVPMQPVGDGQLFNGTTYSNVFLRGSLSFVGSPFIAPSAPEMTRRSFETPMTMTGHLEAFSDFTGQGTPVFSVDVTGAGHLTLGGYIRLADSDGRGVWHAPDGFAAFSIEDGATAPVPEPATLTLLGSGLVATAVRSRRRSRA